MRFVILAIVAWLVLTVFTTVFALSADARQVRVLPKWAWVLISLVVPVIGALLYLFIGKPIETDPKKDTRPIAPDDDPQFLRDLAERLKNKDDDEDTK
jgi:predicted membrane channel-forming protein YqfA (hemolysin III family)